MKGLGVIETALHIDAQSRGVGIRAEERQAVEPETLLEHLVEVHYDRVRALA